MYRWMGFAALSFACGGEADSVDTDTDTTPALDDLRDAISSYETWSGSSTGGAIVPTPEGHHGDYVATWWNDLAWTTVVAEAGAPLPGGSCVVELGYDDPTGNAVRSLLAMCKSDLGVWTLAAWDGTNTDVEPRASGRPTECLDCHAAGQDWILSETW